MLTGGLHIDHLVTTQTEDHSSEVMRGLTGPHLLAAAVEPLR